MMRRSPVILLLLTGLGSRAAVAEEPQLPIPIRFGEAVPQEDASLLTTAPQPAAVELQPTVTATAGEPANTTVSHTAPLALPPRAATGSLAASGKARLPASWVRTASSLVVVLGAFFLLIWIVRRGRPAGDSGDQLFHTLGRVSLLGKQAHIVQFGDKLLLLAKTSSGLEKLAELSRPDEVARISSLCQAGHSSTLTRSVSQFLAAQDGFDERTT